MRWSLLVAASVLVGGCLCQRGPRLGADAGSEAGNGGTDAAPPGVDAAGDGVDAAISMCIFSAEVCDGVDNDCDELVDEGTVCGGMCTASAEVCDGIDNDCDEFADEDGVCDPPPTCGPEVCNGLDDDCDGTADNGVPSGSPCFTFCGFGVNTCVDGAYECNILVSPPESCNGADDDCDGMEDEGTYPCSCGTGMGTCSGGVVTGCASTCVPGSTRWCDDTTYCNWGQQTCSAGGEWGACTEVPGMAPSGCSTCSGSSGDTYCYDTACCVAAGECCEDMTAGFSPGEGPSTGDCSMQCM